MTGSRRESHEDGREQRVLQHQSLHTWVESRLISICNHTV